MIEAFFLDGLEINFQLFNLGLDTVRIDIIQLHTTGRTYANFAVVHVNHLVGMTYQRRRIAGDKHLATPDANDQRTAFSGNDDFVRICYAQHCDAICPNHHLERARNRCEQIVRITRQVVDQRRQHFRVRITFEIIIVTSQHRLEILIIFDNAVVHEVDIAHVVRMCIAFAWLAVRRPARMSDTHRVSRRVRGDFFVQPTNLTLGTQQRDFGLRAHRCDTGTIVPSIFQSFQSRYQDRLRLLFTDIANDSAHMNKYPFAFVVMLRSIAQNIQKI